MLTRLLISALLLFSSSAIAVVKNISVVLIDMQYGFYRRENVENSKGLQDLVKKQQQLLAWAKKENVPVLVFEFEDMGKTDKRITDMLEGHPHAVLIKNIDDGFSWMNRSKDHALAILHSWRAKTLIVTGINGSSCVRDTIQGAGLNGFHVKTSADLVADLTSNPPIYPDDTWFYSHPMLAIMPSMEKIIQASSSARKK